MQTNEITGLNYLLPSDQSTNNFSPHYNNMTQNNIPSFQLNNFYSFQNPSQVVGDFSTPQSSCISSNSTTSEEADHDQNQGQIINERKHRRMISNRESARRSRMRKQKHLDELCSQLLWLRNENHQLLDKLNHVSDSHDRVVQENVQLKEETSELRQMVCDLQIHSPLSSPLSPLGDVPSTTTSPHVKSDNSSNHSVE